MGTSDYITPVKKATITEMWVFFCFLGESPDVCLSYSTSNHHECSRFYFRQRVQERVQSERIITTFSLFTIITIQTATNQLAKEERSQAIGD
jgi:hypothetical protein